MRMTMSFVHSGGVYACISNGVPCVYGASSTTSRTGDKVTPSSCCFNTCMNVAICMFAAVTKCATFKYKSFAHNDLLIQLFVLGPIPLSPT